MDLRTNQIYETVQEQINIVIHKLENNNIQDDNTILDSVDYLNNYNNETIKPEFEELRKVSEWDIFTVALYGETNAGKSTIIEALRLYLNENTKKQEQANFLKIDEKIQSIKKSTSTSHNKIQSIQQSIENNCNEIGVIIQSIKDNRNKIQLVMQSTENTHNQVHILKNEFQDIKQEFENLQLLVKEKIEKMNWFRKILSIFFPLKEKKSLNNKEQEFSEKEKQYVIEEKKLKQQLEEYENELEILNKQMNKYEDEEKELKQQIKEYENELENLKQQIEKQEKEQKDLEEELELYSDGRIIGDGRSDFTQKNHRYDFQYQDKSFALIDVPGIEGSQNLKLNDEIKNAIRTAHAVLYITSVARPPQTGDGEKGVKRTLELMKEQLSSQSEVWAIYNHRVKNPRQLKAGLLSDDQLSGLDELDNKLKEELGEQYQYKSIMKISAEPAFLALSKCLIKDCDFDKAKIKFNAQFSDTEILSIAFDHFIEQLTNNVIGDKDRIIKNNKNKALKMVKSLIEEMKKIQSNVNNTTQKTEEEASIVIQKVEELFSNFFNDLDNSFRKIVDEEKKEFRNEMYDSIDSDISNDRCKNELEYGLEELSEIIEYRIKSETGKKNKELMEKIEKIVGRYKENVQSLLISQNEKLSMHGSRVSFNVDSGVKKLDLALSVAGGIIATLATGGWALLALAGSVVQFFKAIWGLIDSDYKKSQQKKSVDENLSEFSKKCMKKLQEKIEEYKEENGEKFGEFKNNIYSPVQGLRDCSRTIELAINDLENIH